MGTVQLFDFLAPEITQGDIATFASDKVNLKSDDAEIYREQVRILREHLDRYIAEPLGVEVITGVCSPQFAADTAASTTDIRGMTNRMCLVGMILAFRCFGFAVETATGVRPPNLRLTLPPLQLAVSIVILLSARSSFQTAAEAGFICGLEAPEHPGVRGDLRRHGCRSRAV